MLHHRCGQLAALEKREKRFDVFGKGVMQDTLAFARGLRTINQRAVVVGSLSAGTGLTCPIGAEQARQCCRATAMLMGSPRGRKNP